MRQMGSKEVQRGGPTMDEVAQQSRWKTIRTKAYIPSLRMMRQYSIPSLSGPSLGSHSIRVGVGQSGKDNAGRWKMDCGTHRQVTLAALEATRTAETAGKDEMEDVD